MSSEERTKPTNKQLARFLEIVASTVPGAEGIHPSAEILEMMLNENPLYREAALRKHRRFQQQIDEVHKKMERGQLQCDHIRPNGKMCPNWNQPGSFYCGLHKDQYDLED